VTITDNNTAMDIFNLLFNENISGFSRSFTYKMFICAAESSDYPLVQGVPNQTVTWYRNCIEINSSEITSYNSGLPTSLSDIWVSRLP